MNARTPMPEPGEPKAPDTDAPRHRDEVDHDDLIGFASPAALRGQTREVSLPSVEPEALPVADVPPEPRIVAEPPVQEPVVQPVFDTTPRRPAPTQPPFAESAARREPPASPEPTPAWSRETPPSEQPADSWTRRKEQPALIDGAMGLYTVYALILFAVPTLGVSAVIALFAVLTRSAPQEDVALSHFRFQKRTLVIGAGVAVVGGVLIAVGLGVFVLFALAIWLILRGTSGILKLKSGRPIERPGTLLL